MPLKVVVGTVEKDVARMEVTKGGVQKRVTRIEAYDGSAWKLVQSFAPPISLSASPLFVEGTRNFPGITPVDTNTTTATPVGGNAPYTYAWAQTSGPSATIASPLFATTGFRMSLGPGDSEQAQFTCTVTDANGLTAQAIVTATFSNISGA